MNYALAIIISIAGLYLGHKCMTLYNSLYKPVSTEKYDDL